jgi:hypothetical protein
MNQSLSYEFQHVMTEVQATGLLSSLCTIQQRPLTAGQPKVSASGQVDLTPADFTDIVGLVNIPCQIMAKSIFRPDTAGVKRMPSSFDDSQGRHVLLNGYYPAILDTYQAVVDGTPYQIQSVEHDSQRIQTRLALQVSTK